MTQASSDRVEVSRPSRAAPEVVWWTLTARRAAWWPEMELDAHPGASLRETWEENGVIREAIGNVVIAEPPFRLTFRWTQPEWPHGYATVAIRIVPHEAGSLVTILETDLARATGDPAQLDAHEQGWHYHLERLVASSESTNS